MSEDQTKAKNPWDEDAYWDAQDHDDEEWQHQDDWYDAAGSTPAPVTTTPDAPVAQESSSDISDNDEPEEDTSLQVEADVADDTDEEPIEPVDEDTEGITEPVVDEAVVLAEKERRAQIDVDEDLDASQLEEADPNDWIEEEWEKEDESELRALAESVAAKEAEEEAAAKALEEALLLEAEAEAAANEKNDDDDEEDDDDDDEPVETSSDDDDDDDDDLEEAESAEDDDDEDDDNDDNEENEPVETTEPTPALPLGGPGEIGQNDPAWVSSFVGVRGVGFVFLFAFLVYAVFAGNRFTKQSPNPHFVYLADAYLKKQWAFPSPPKSWLTNRRLNNDWAQVDEIRVTRINGKAVRHIKTLRGKWWYSRAAKKRYFVSGGKLLQINYKDIRSRRKVHFVSFPPMPAVMMAGPMWVLSKMGYNRLRYNDVFFSLMFAAFAVMLLFLVLQQLSFAGYSQRTLFENLQLTTLFAFGTVFFYTSVQGTVWFTALVVGAFFSLAFLWLTIDGRWPILAGLCVGAAFLTRPILVLLSIFFLLWTIRKDEQWTSPFDAENFKKLLTFALPVAGVLAGTFYFNYQRFGAPMEFGHTYLPAVFHRAMDHGLFHPHWAIRNAYAFFLAPPEILSKAPYIRFNGHGLSMFITTPALLLFFIVPKEQRNALYWSALGVAGLIFLPHLFYQNTGWVTFGNRFSVDYLPLLFVALAVCGVGFRKLWGFFFLFAIAINAFGAATFNRQMQYYKVWPYGSLDWIFKLFS